MLKMVPMSMCLGARVVTVKGGQLSSNNDAATILMEFKDDDDDPVLDIRLSTGTKTYCCSVSFPDISDVFGGNKDGGDNTNTTATRMIEFGRHFLREHPTTTSDNEGNNQHEKSLSGTKFDDIVISFEYNDTTAGGIDDEEDINTTKGINLIIREKLQHGMKKIILRSKMKEVEGKLSYCIPIGETLNKSIDEVTKLKSQVSMWKKTAEDLDRTQQDNKDTLLANFTKLRNFLNEKYQKELEELKQLHEEEKKTWKKESSSIITAPKKVRPKRKDDPVQDYEELFEGENQIDCLAEGRKTSKTKHRKALLKEPIDMVGIQREEQEYNNKKSSSKSKKRKKHKKVQQPLSSTDDDDDDDDDDNGNTTTGTGGVDDSAGGEWKSGRLRTDDALLVGAMAGTMSAFVTNPLDVITCRLMTQRMESASLGPGAPVHPFSGQGYGSRGSGVVYRYAGIWDCAHKIWMREGMRGLFSGWQPRVLRMGSLASLQFCAYETIRGLFWVESDYS